MRDLVWVLALVLVGCAKAPPLPPPHALDDAALAAQRASEAVQSTVGTSAIVPDPKRTPSTSAQTSDQR